MQNQCTESTVFLYSSNEQSETEIKNNTIAPEIFLGDEFHKRCARPNCWKVQILGSSVTLCFYLSCIGLRVFLHYEDPCCVHTGQVSDMFFILPLPLFFIFSSFWSFSCATFLFCLLYLLNSCPFFPPLCISLSAAF